MKLQDAQNETEAHWLTLAGVHAALGQPAISRAALEHAAEIAPQSRDVALALSRLDLRTGDVAGATRRSAELLRQYPDDPAVIAFEADVRNASGDFAAAAAALDRMRQKSPSAALAVATYQARRAPVSSEAAVKLATRAFTALEQKSDLGRAEALRGAMLATITDGCRAAHPAYWAPFVLIAAEG